MSELSLQEGLATTRSYPALHRRPCDRGATRDGDAPGDTSPVGVEPAAVPVRGAPGR